jgi:hypothetical protein
MAFRFLHSADWQIGKRFGAFPPEKASLLREARFEAVATLAKCAGSRGVHHVLVAGDIFETETSEQATRRKLFAILRQHETLRWHLLPGNHDPGRPGGLWDACRKDGLPANVTLHLEAKPVEIEPGVFLLPCPIATRHVHADPTEWLRSLALPAGAFRIGLAHGSVEGFTGDSARPLDHVAAEQHLSYFALGDWHGAKQVGERSWYSGTPEPDRFKGNEPGHVLLVGLDAPEAPPQVEIVPVGQYHWAESQFHVTGDGDLARLQSHIVGHHPESRKLLMKLIIDGLVPLATRLGLQSELDRLGDELFHLDSDLGALHLRAETSDLDLIDRSGELRHAAERLLALAQSDAPNRDIAEGALARLHAWSART